MNFASDNTAPVAPEILAALSAASSGCVPSYGADPWTAQVKERLQSLFGHRHGRQRAGFGDPDNTLRRGDLP
jgi:threonine aldolase